MLGEEISMEFSGSDETAYAFAASPSFAKDGICFAATSSGLYRSTAGGRTWELLRITDEPATPMAVTALALSPAFAQDRTLFAAVKGGILRSSDGGDTWFAARFPAPPPLFTALAVSPDFARDGFMLAGSMEDGVFSSTDRGLNWQPWNFGLFDLGVLCLAASPCFQADETIFAGTETGLYRSANGGRAWRESEFPSELAPILSLAYLEHSSDGKDETLLYAGTEENGLYVSRGKGECWHRVAAEPLSGAVNQLQVLRKPDGAAVIVALTDDGVMISGDAGKSWKCLVQTQDPATTFLLPDDSGNTLFLGLTGKGLVRFEL